MHKATKTHTHTQKVAGFSFNTQEWISLRVRESLRTGADPNANEAIGKATEASGSLQMLFGTHCIIWCPKIGIDTQTHSFTLIYTYRLRERTNEIDEYPKHKIYLVAHLRIHIKKKKNTRPNVSTLSTLNFIIKLFLKTCKLVWNLALAFFVITVMHN